MDIYATNFEALVDQGEIVIVIENTGEITADFSVGEVICVH